MTRRKTACVLCGKDPAAGFAMIGDDRYCHGDYDPDPTCYMRGQGDYMRGQEAERGWGAVLLDGLNEEPPF